MKKLSVRGCRGTEQLAPKPLVAALGLSAVLAGQAGAAVLEEVVITAQKREQSLQDVGIAVTAFSGDQMRALGMQESYDVAAFSPGVHVGGSMGGQNTQFTIRGVTQNDYNDIVEAPNAVYVDEGYIAIAQGQSFALFDIDRVEVLKGPQGTLFGRNATGGLVHYITNKPTFEPEGFVDITYGEYDTDADADQFTVEAAIGGGLTETLAGRFAVRYNDRDGYLKNIYPYSAFGLGSLGITDSNSPGPGAGADLGGDERARAHEIDLLRHQIDEIASVDPTPGEEDDLAAEEDLLEITGPDLVRLAWHIGNRHMPCQIEADRLLIQRDHVIRDMLNHLGATLREVSEPFTPEGGAYGHGRTHAHAH